MAFPNQFAMLQPLKAVIHQVERRPSVELSCLAVKSWVAASLSHHPSMLARLCQILNSLLEEVL